MADIRRRKFDDDKPEIFSGADSSDHVSFFFVNIFGLYVHSLITNIAKKFFVIFD